MHLSLIVELVLTVLLAATLCYCAVLERKLTALRKGQDGLKDIIADLNSAIGAAGTSMRMLKAAASGAGETLDEKVSGARAAIDELALLTASGERIAQRIERGVEPARKAGILPAASERLERPRILRPESRLAEAVGGLR